MFNFVLGYFLRWDSLNDASTDRIYLLKLYYLNIFQFSQFWEREVGGYQLGVFQTSLAINI